MFNCLWYIISLENSREFFILIFHLSINSLKAAKCYRKKYVIFILHVKLFSAFITSTSHVLNKKTTETWKSRIPPSKVHLDLFIYLSTTCSVYCEHLNLHSVTPTVILSLKNSLFCVQLQNAVQVPSGGVYFPAPVLARPTRLLAVLLLMPQILFADIRSI